MTMLNFTLFGILAQIGIVLIVLFAQFLLVKIDDNIKPVKMLKIDPKTLSVAIIGYTGESGKALAKEILSNNIFKSTTLIGRRLVNDNEIFKNGNQVVVDYDNLESSSDVFKQDVIYCCLGTTRGKSGADGFRKVDYDYVVNTARLAKQNGVKQFHLVSSSGADKNSFLLYPKTKGESEDVVSQLQFDKLSIYRPKMLVVDGGRNESRFGERIALAITAPFKFIAPQLIHTPIDKLAKSMVRNTISYNQDDKVEILDNAKIFDLSAKYDDKTH